MVQVSLLIDDMIEWCHVCACHEQFDDLIYTYTYSYSFLASHLISSLPSCFVSSPPFLVYLLFSYLLVSNSIRFYTIQSSPIQCLVRVLAVLCCSSLTQYKHQSNRKESYTVTLKIHWRALNWVSAVVSVCSRGEVSLASPIDALCSIDARLVEYQYRLVLCCLVDPLREANTQK
jgi:hypothetical protein